MFPDFLKIGGIPQIFSPDPLKKKKYMDEVRRWFGRENDEKVVWV